MRNCFPVVLALCCMIFLFLNACSTPQHTNTLIFGTNTKLAVDISASNPPTPPGVTLGFTRQEFVWMPLAINLYRTDDQGHTRLEPCTQNDLARCFYRGNDSTSGNDAYSVLASFGSKTSGTEGGVSIAQYFATGLAARTLASQGSAIVSTAAVSQLASQRAAELKSNTDKIIAYVQDTQGNTDGTKLDTLLPGTGLENDDYFKSFKGKPAGLLRKALEGEYSASVSSLAKNIKK